MNFAAADRDQIVSALQQLAMNGIPGRHAARLIDVGTNKFVRYFDEEVLRDLVAPGGATVRFFEGPYGAGKTHLLSLLGDNALNRGFAVVETELTANLNLDDWHAVTRHILQNIQAEVGGQHYRSLPRILEAIRMQEDDFAFALAALRVPHPGFKEAIAKMLGMTKNGERKQLIKNYLLGDKVTAGQLRDCGVKGVKNPLTKRNAESVLRTVIACMRALGFTGTLLLFDEAEKTFVVRGDKPTKRVIVGANLMRRMIDACTTGSLTGAVAVFAVLPGFLQRCAEAYPALGQRLEITGMGARGWRSPVLKLSDVNSVETADLFLTESVAVFERLASACGSHLNGLRGTLQERGRNVLEANAGDGYRRPLMKILASTTLEVVEA